MKPEDRSTPAEAEDDAAPQGAPPAPPPALRAVFPRERVDLVVRYAQLLATDGVLRGLIGPREAPRLWERHIVNCALLAPALPAGGSVADVGSGAGLPGIVLALARPDVELTLIEPLLRRTTFLEEVVADLGLDNVTVRRMRADALHGEARFDVVTARAVAPLDGLADWCMPLVAPEGALLAMKGESAEAEIDAARDHLRALGCASPEVEVLGADVDPGLGVEPIRVVRIAWADPARVSWPALGTPAAHGTRKAAPRAARRGASRNKRRKT
ncbi:16S rRNA (guanine(527)-N(7))-methyltransferase RsmG [Nocardioides sp. SYSU DS0651]|uniref:16S rRNA (guanine(527)-N(7))-methyltransferase RsmG n=1 Tax=Nocardioides sp. SYSU DS0651 TaxID=3415955 RepID=UPI003F4B85DF